MDISSSPMRLGLIGVGQRLCKIIGDMIAFNKGIQVTAAYDPDDAAFERAQVLGHNLTFCSSEEELVSRDDVDWVFIGSPNCHHARQAIMAMRGGKNVFCEKPLATNWEDCLEVCETESQTGQIFAFGLVLRYAPHYQKIREIICSGAIGELISLEFNETLNFSHGGYIFGNWRRNRAIAGTHLLEKCCHDIDLVNWITGQLPSRVASFGGLDFFVPANAGQVNRIGADSNGQSAYESWPDPHRINPFSPGSDILDNQVAIFEYQSGLRATFHTNCNAGIPERRFYICGTEGTLRADTYTGRIEWRKIGHYTSIQSLDTNVTDGHAGGDEIMAKGLVDTLFQGAEPLATAKDGLNSCAVVFAIDRARDERQIVELSPWIKDINKLCSQYISRNV